MPKIGEQAMPSGSLFMQRTANSELERTESDCLVKTNHCDALARCWRNVIPAQCSEGMMRLNQARVNGGSNYDSLQVAKCLVI